MDARSTQPFLRRKIRDTGGGTIFAFRLVQVLEVLALLGISLAQLVLHTHEHEEYEAGGVSATVLITQCALYVRTVLTGLSVDSALTREQGYLSLLGLLSLFGSRAVNGHAFTHLSWVLVFVWCAYIYRDIWPLATIDLVPADADEGPFLWAKLALLTISAVVVPIFVPREYVPVDPKVRVP